MHIERRGTLFYWVEWGTDKKGARFINAYPTEEGNDRFARKVKRWVGDVFDELGDAYDKAMKGLPFDMVQWTR